MPRGSLLFGVFGALLAACAADDPSAGDPSAGAEPPPDAGAVDHAEEPGDAREDEVVTGFDVAAAECSSPAAWNACDMAGVDASAPAEGSPCDPTASCDFYEVPCLRCLTCDGESRWRKSYCVH